MLIEKFHHVAFRCKDAKETVEWYGKNLGMDFKLAIAEDQRGGIWVGTGMMPSNAKAAQRMKADLGEVSLVHDGSGIAAVYATDRNSVLVCATEINAKSGAWIDLGFGTVTKDLHFPPGYLGLGAADPEDSRAVSALLRGAWTLYNEPAEVDVTATTVNRESVITGRTAGKRKIRRQEIAIVDIRRRVGAQVERVADADSGERPVVEHDYRWPVRGHWRMQPHGEGRTQRRKIWIDAQVRGPEDKPLKTRPRVSVVG